MPRRRRAHSAAMRSAVLVIAALALALSCVHAASPPPPGPVTNLPGLPSGVPPLTMYSGYIPIVPDQSYTFFWMIEATQADPTKAPLLIWLQGGPGGSSMFGLFGEHGPFSVSADGSSLVMRQYAWTNNFNVMYIDNPVGTGFSYTMSNDGFATDENEVGQDLLNFLYQFYELYPQYQNLPLYITGESYAVRSAC